MNKLLTLTGITLATLALAACSPGLNEGVGHRITFDSSGMAVHATGEPDAHVGKDGGLAIDGRAVDVTPAQRAMLHRYYGEARSMMQSGEVVGKQGAAMAERGIDNAIASLLHGDSSKAQKNLEAQSNQIDSAVGKLCTDLKALDDTQQTLATEIPAFAPYAPSSRTDCTVTSTTTVRNGNIVVAKSSATTAATPAAHPGSSSASTSSKP
ncbi:MAG TPA: DUF2884 family protein [Rhodanobacteraceae bacterium]|nr:DUF2884 family protein [Rhodanobacteraceae bacterium]